MPKTIVTHKNPDLDAIMSVWLLVRFDQSRYGDAKLEFIPASTTYKDLPVDSDPEVVHTDVAYGRFDHHQPGAPQTCASKLVWEYLVAQNLVSPTDQALESMIEYAMEIDHFQDCFWDEAKFPRFAFTLSEIIPAMHRLQVYDNEAVTRTVWVYLDAVYQRLKDAEKSAEAIRTGQVFESAWGRGIVVVTGADDVSKAAQRQGYMIVVVHDPEKGYLKIKLRPDASHDLQALYDKIVLAESPKRWFYHNSGLMLFSGSDKGSAKEKTELTPADILEMVKGVSV